MLWIERTEDDAGANRVCELCDALFVSAASQPRAWIDGDYLGFICHGCADAEPEVLLTRIQPALNEARTRLSLLERAAQRTREQTPVMHRQAFRVVGRR